MPEHPQAVIRYPSICLLLCIVTLAGIFTLASGVVGLYAISYERVEDTRIYLWTRFVLVVPESLELLAFVLYGDSLLGLVGHVKDMMVFLYQTLVRRHDEGFTKSFSQTVPVRLDLKAERLP